MITRYDATGNVAIVTGAARGVGRETVIAFADAGAHVIAVDRESDGLGETCRNHQATTRKVTADITKPADVERIVATAQHEFGRIDICVNNAAVAPHASILDESPDTWDTVYAVNCRGTFLMIQATARLMLEQGDGGRIINFSSGVARSGSPGAATYASSRAAVEGLTRVAAIELAPGNILVNCIRPGLIDTQPKPLPPAMATSLQRRIPQLPLARAGTATEVAETVLWLSSDSASYVTGAVIDVDGGSALGTRRTEPIVDDDPRYFWVKASSSG